jgi:hypothetical protein
MLEGVLLTSMAKLHAHSCYAIAIYTVYQRRGEKEINQEQTNINAIACFRYNAEAKVEATGAEAGPRRGLTIQ